ncbi:MAG: SRPBCC domain-containing protein [Chloroflexi bacterium]|nr:SRPBCC domain-containing protein [Chloroflexota bacterium]
MTVRFEVSDVIPARPLVVFAAWLDGDSHTKMTGGEATGEPAEGAEFTAWDGYISGRNIELIPGALIVQSWRTAQFDDSDPDSRLEITLEAVGEEETRLTLTHSDVPDDQAAGYESGWSDHYFEPMKKYFGG